MIASCNKSNSDGVSEGSSKPISKRRACVLALAVVVVAVVVVVVVVVVAAVVVLGEVESEEGEEGEVVSR